MLFRSDLGEIKVGALADIISVDGNPLDDLGVLQSPDRLLKLIMKAGRIYKEDC